MRVLRGASLQTLGACVRAVGGALRAGAVSHRRARARGERYLTGQDESSAVPSVGARRPFAGLALVAALRPATIALRLQRSGSVEYPWRHLFSSASERHWKSERIAREGWSLLCVEEAPTGSRLRAAASGFRAAGSSRGRRQPPGHRQAHRQPASWSPGGPLSGQRGQTKLPLFLRQRTSEVPLCFCSQWRGRLWLTEGGSARELETRGSPGAQVGWSPGHLSI